MNFTELELIQLSIHDLRMVARSVGVRAPTSKKKIDIIKEIIEIQEGKREPYRTKKGRPIIERNPSVERVENKITTKTLKSRQEQLQKIEELLTQIVNIFDKIKEEN